MMIEITNLSNENGKALPIRNNGTNIVQVPLPSLMVDNGGNVLVDIKSSPEGWSRVA